jgi:hypothetical protein
MLPKFSFWESLKRHSGIIPRSVDQVPAVTEQCGTVTLIANLSNPQQAHIPAVHEGYLQRMCGSTLEGDWPLEGGNQVAQFITIAADRFRPAAVIA